MVACDIWLEAGWWLRSCKTVREVDISPATISWSLILNPTSYETANCAITVYGESSSPKVVRFLVSEMEARPDLAYAHYYSTLNLGDEIQLRKAVIGFHSSDAWISRRVSLRTLWWIYFQFPTWVARFRSVAVSRSANFQRFVQYIPQLYPTNTNLRQLSAKRQFWGRLWLIDMDSFSNYNEIISNQNMSERSCAQNNVTCLVSSHSYDMYHICVNELTFDPKCDLR